MTVAWYGHLKNHSHSKLWAVVLISWSVALLEYCFQVPANRLGSKYFTLPQLKVIQEILSMGVFALFALFYMKIPLNRNFLYASVCLIMAAFFIFKDGIKS